MIYTLTLNPALDYLVTLPALVPGTTNQCLTEAAHWGGKGVNVSIVLAALGVPSVVMGFLGGFTGHAIRRGLKTMGLRTDFIELEDRLTRINIKIRGQDGQVTEIKGSGPAIDPDSVKLLKRRLSLIGEGDALVFAGNVPEPLGDDFYLGLMADLAARGAEVVLDAAGEPLAKALAERPALVKLNLSQLAAICGAPAQSDQEAAAAARAVLALGAQSVLVPMAARGAILAESGGRVLKATAAQGAALDPSGAGDALLAGFLAGQAKGLSAAESLRLGSAAGSATAFSAKLAEGPAIEALRPQVVVSEI
jgi:1-phosphofructokinase